MEKTVFDQCNRKWIVFLCIFLLSIGIIGLPAYYYLFIYPESAPSKMTIEMGHLRSFAIGLRQYIIDNNGLPKTMKQLEPYLQSQVSNTLFTDSVEQLEY